MQSRYALWCLQSDGTGLTPLHEIAGALGDEFWREVQVLVDVGIRRRRAESPQADHLTTLANPALPTQRRGGLHTQACADRRRQHLVTIALRFVFKELP